jgi:hypothetical protein
MASNFETEHADAVACAKMMIQAAAQQWHFWTLSFRLCSTHWWRRMPARCPSTGWKPAMRFTRAAGFRLGAPDKRRGPTAGSQYIPEPEIRLLQEYLIKNPGALAGRTANDRRLALLLTAFYIYATDQEITCFDGWLRNLDTAPPPGTGRDLAMGTLLLVKRALRRQLDAQDARDEPTDHE